jgi:hypothetical protein
MSTYFSFSIYSSPLMLSNPCARRLWSGAWRSHRWCIGPWIFVAAMWPTTDQSSSYSSSHECMITNSKGKRVPTHVWGHAWSVPIQKSNPRCGKTTGGSIAGVKSSTPVARSSVVSRETGYSSNAFIHTCLIEETRVSSRLLGKFVIATLPDPLDKLRVLASTLDEVNQC